MPSTEKKPAKSELAHDPYLKGLYASQKQTKEALEEGVRFFETAIDRDPEFSLPHSALAHTLVLMGGAHVPFTDVRSRAQQLVTRALELDPNSSDAHLAAGNLALQCDLDWKKAEAELQKALTLNPGNFSAHAWYATLLALNQRFDDARDEFREAIRLNPSADLAWMGLVLTEYHSGDVYAATTLAEELVDRNPTSVLNRLLLAYCYEAEGRSTDVLKELDKLPVPTDLTSRVARAALSALAGRPDEARSMVRELEERSKTSFVPRLSIAQLYASLGEKNKALELLERDFREGDRGLSSRYQDPEFRTLRTEPRFTGLLREYHLPLVKDQRPLEVQGVARTGTPSPVVAT